MKPQNLENDGSEKIFGNDTSDLTVALSTSVQVPIRLYPGPDRSTYLTGMLNMSDPSQLKDMMLSSQPIALSTCVTPVKRLPTGGGW